MSRFGCSVVVLCICGVAGAEEAKPAPAANAAIAANNAFACDLYRRLDAEKNDGNVFFSPYSVANALAIALEGARGDTAGEMGTALRLPQTLRQANPNVPWQTQPFLLGFGELNRRLAAAEGADKANTLRTRLTAMRAELDQLNKQIVEQQRSGKIDRTLAVMKKAEALADSINVLSKQVDPFELAVANALWADKRSPLKAEFVRSVDQALGIGHVKSADFAGNFPAERAAINGWVEEQTRRRIQELVPPLSAKESAAIRLAIVNAIYFKGQWSEPFPEGSTRKEDFQLAKGGQKPAMLMRHFHRSAKYAAFNGDGSAFKTPREVPRGQAGAKVQVYPDEDGFTVAEIPMRGDKLAMTVILPRKVNGLARIASQLTSDGLSRWLGNLEDRPVDIVMPRFKLETNYDLGPTLKSLGMTRAFSRSEADFAGISASTRPDDQLFISMVLHKAFVDVAEKGAEAAAATAILFEKKSERANDEPPIPFHPQFRADHPFVFVIREIETGAVLFVGRVNEP